MVETIFDLANMLGNSSMWFWYILLVALIGVWAKSKNRSPWNWVILAIFISPFLAGLFLLFSGKLKEQDENYMGSHIYCHNCGTKNKETTSFCPNCGEKQTKRSKK